MTPAPGYGLVLCSQFTSDDDVVTRFAEQVEQVRFARDAGFSSVWATQHYLADPFQYLHPLAVLSRIVPESGEMRLGTAITLMALNNPVDIAEELATLDIMSGGRLTVGAGLGYRDTEFDAFGVPRQARLRRFLDNLDLVRRLWTEDEVTFTGDAVKLDAVKPVLRPVQRPPRRSGWPATPTVPCAAPHGWACRGSPQRHTSTAPICTGRSTSTAQPAPSTAGATPPYRSCRRSTRGRATRRRSRTYAPRWA